MPSGQLQNKPDGTRISVLDTAAYMISISDNTAADMLINLLGERDKLGEASLARRWPGQAQDLVALAA